MSEAALEKEIEERPWEPLQELVDAGNAEAISELLGGMSADEQRFSMSHLSGEAQGNLVALLSPEEAAELLERLPESQPPSKTERIVFRKRALPMTRLR